jgi:hypothetical protein
MEEQQPVDQDAEREAEIEQEMEHLEIPAFMRQGNR